MLSDDTISLRHLPRQSSKNCDLQFANNDRFKANYSIDKLLIICSIHFRMFCNKIIDACRKHVRFDRQCHTIVTSFTQLVCLISRNATLQHNFCIQHIYRSCVCGLHSHCGMLRTGLSKFAVHLFIKVLIIISSRKNKGTLATKAALGIFRDILLISIQPMYRALYVLL